MTVIPRLRAGFRRSTAEEAATDIAVHTLEENKNAIGVSDAAVRENDADLKPWPELPSGDAQQGVKTIEAVTLTWSKASLIAVFLL
jgi:hypothetical protein